MLVPKVLHEMDRPSRQPGEQSQTGGDERSENERIQQVPNSSPCDLFDICLHASHCEDAGCSPLSGGPPSKPRGP